MLALDDGRFLKSFLPINLVPSTSTPYLGLRLEIVRVPWSLNELMAYFLADSHGNALMSLDC